MNKLKMLITQIFDKTFLKFIIVGVINTIFGTAIMFLLYNLAGCNYWVSSSSNYVFGSILSYFLNKHFTFKNTEKGFGIIIKFIINISICYFMAYGLAKPIVHYALSETSTQFRDNFSMLVGMCLFVGFNYIGQRFFAFRSKEV